jgi:L-serine dehydratase
MASAAAVEMLGGTPAMAANACAIAFKNMLGLVCDPVAGLVEVPCIKRNAGGAANAIAAAEMALAGIESAIPVDEVIASMKAVGESMPSSLRETAGGGLAATPTARRFEEKNRLPL